MENWGVIVSVITCFGGLAIWLFKMGNRWGRLEEKLDGILGMKEDTETRLNNHENRLTTLETACNIHHGTNQ